jgi:hypothetical protein
MSKLKRWLQSPLTAWWAGVIVPPVMVAADPAIFRGNGIGEGGMLGFASPGCYCAILLGMGALAYHLRSKRRSAFVAGVLAAATLFATVLGVVMLPIAILGTLFLGIGLLGLSPFFAALAIGPQARCAYAESAGVQRIPRFWLGFALYAGICAVAQWQIDSAWLRSATTLKPF